MILYGRGLFFAATIVLASSLSRADEDPKASMSRAEEIPKVSQYLSGTKAGHSFDGQPFSLEWGFISYDGRKVDSWVGGNSFLSPRYVVDYLRLSVSGTRVPIPREAYVDIYDPNPYDGGPDLLQDSKFLYVVVNASDASGFAKITLKFSDGKYVGRKIED